MGDLGDLGKLNSAVAMLHETRDPSDNVLQQRRSSVLLYVDNRLGGPEGDLIPPGSAGGVAPMQMDARGPGQGYAHGELLQAD